MSKASTRKRNKITLALGAFTMITFGGVYGMIAHNPAIEQSAVAAVAVTSDAQTTALVLTDKPTVAATPAPTAVPTSAPTAQTVVATAEPTPEPTAIPTAQPMVANVDTNTRAS